MDMGCSTRMMESKRDLANYCSNFADWTKEAWGMFVVANQENVAGSAMQLLYIAGNYILKAERMKMGQQAYLFVVFGIGNSNLTSRLVPFLPMPL